MHILLEFKVWFVNGMIEYICFGVPMSHDNKKVSLESGIWHPAIKSRNCYKLSDTKKLNDFLNRKKQTSYYIDWPDLKWTFVDDLVLSDP